MNNSVHIEIKFYLKMIQKFIVSGQIEKLSNADLKLMGADIEFYEGFPLILDDLKKIHNHDASDGVQEEVNGVFISKKLLKRESKRSCPVCNTYSFKSNDDVYMTKFDCCEKCYIQWIEGREDRWKKGWRPNANNQKTT